MKRILLWSLALGVAGLIVAAFGVRFWFLSVFLPSEPCRLQLNRSVSRALHARGEFMPLQADSGSLYSDGFQAEAGPGFQRLRADQIRGEVRFALLERQCAIERLEVNRLRLDLGSSTPALEAAPSLQGSSGSDERGFGSGFQVSIRQLRVNSFELVGSGLEWKGTCLTAEPEGGAARPSLGGADWLVNGRGGVLKYGTWPQWRVQNLDARLRGRAIVLTSAQLRCGDHAEAQVEGELEAGTAQARIAFSGVPAAEWLPEDWRARLMGNFSGRLNLSAPQGEAVNLEGTLALSEGELTALPVLDQIATATHIDQFRRLRIHKGSARISHVGPPLTGTLRVSQFLMESDGLLKVEGGFIVKAGQIDGTLQVGVAPAVLQSIPGARERVFTVERDGYLWTSVRVTGPAEHPAEDLTPRLMSAAAEAVVNDVQQSVRDNAKTLLELVKPLVPASLPSVLPGMP